MKTILIVDDEDQIRSIYRKVIYIVGRSIFKIVESSSTEDVVDALMKENVDLVLLDIRMPNIDSRLLYQIIKTYNPSIRVIVASVYPTDVQRKMLPLADDYYDKSWGPIKLIEKLTNTLVRDI